MLSFPFPRLLKAAPMAGETATILIVHPSPTNLMILADAITAVGWEVLVAMNHESATSQAYYTQPEIILIDVNPSVAGENIDSFETCYQIKSNPETCHIPIIFLTDLTDTASKLRGFEVGGVDYITKPIDSSEVHARVRTHLKIHELYQQLARQHEVLQLEIEQRRLADRHLQEANDRLARLVTLDPLTQVANRRRLNDYSLICWQHLQHQSEAMAIILCDIDWFRLYNEAYGYAAGDRCLCQIAEALSATILRTSDLVARYGGEEFAIVLPNTGLQGAWEVAQRLCSAIRDLALPHDRSPLGHVTLSAGLAAMVPAANLSISALMNQAESALQAAKDRGRNCIAGDSMAGDMNSTDSDINGDRSNDAETLEGSGASGC